jgi:hypothetical protein
MADSLSNLDISHLISNNESNIYKNSFMNRSKMLMNKKNTFEEYKKIWKLQKNKA